MNTEDLFWSNIPQSLQYWRKYFFGLVVEGNGFVRGLYNNFDYHYFFRSYVGEVVTVCSSRVYDLLKEVFRQHEWAKFPDGFPLPIDVSSQFFSFRCSEAVNPHHSDFQVRFLFTEPDKSEALKALSARSQSSSWLKVKSPKSEPQQLLGGSAWPDDIVFTIGTASSLFYFPDYAINGYRAWESHARIIVDQLQVHDGGPPFQNFQEWRERQNAREYTRQNSEAMLVTVYTPEHLFVVFGVFSEYLGKHYGLGGYDSVSCADLVEIRKQVFRSWYETCFPHVCGRERTDKGPDSSVSPELSAKAEEVLVSSPSLPSPSLAVQLCVVCDHGEQGFVCGDCSPNVAFLSCGCISHRNVRSMIWYCPGCAGG